MNLKKWFKGYLLVASVILIGTLLLVNIYLIYQNSLIIERNIQIQQEAESIKVHTLDITRNMHLVDMAVRSFALVQKHAFYAAVDSAFIERKKIFKSLDRQLNHQRYPMNEFYALRDTIIQYFALVDSMRNYTINNQQNKFLKVLNEDPGDRVFLQYRAFSKNVYAFENQIVQEAKASYKDALQNTYLLQIILFLITMPTLVYTAYYTYHALRISEKLRRSDEENSRILSVQKAKLEKLVNIRTMEIQTRNEEIIKQNEQLQEAKHTIEDQNRIIQTQNEILVLEVARQTRDLKATNFELVEQNNRLEQFTYIISHNLRAPLARLIGLSSIFSHAKDREEIANIIDKMVHSANDLDEVIKDLAYILEIQQMDTHILSKVNLQDVLAKTIQRLEPQIKKTNCEITVSSAEPVVLNSLPAYLDSIFYNLVSNAIKYRHPDRTPTVDIQITSENNFVRIDVHDNGLGIDLDKYADKLFTLYKRFHLHVEGKGLGLYLIKTQINMLGGKIDVTSTLEEGTTFTVFLKKSQ